MKIYYSRVNGTDDGPNGSAINTFLEKIDMKGKAIVSQYDTSNTPMYNYDKIDEADLLIVGYNPLNYRSSYFSGESKDKFVIGKGVWSEITRAFDNETGVFFLNLYDKEDFHLESLSPGDISLLGGDSWKSFATINLCRQENWKISLNQSKKEILEKLRKLLGQEVITEEIKNESNITFNNKLLLLK